MVGFPRDSVLLETARSNESEGRSLLFAAPREVLELTHPYDSAAFFRDLKEGTEKGLYAAGFFCYEMAACFENVPARPAGNLPLAWFGLYEAPEPFTHHSHDPEADVQVSVQGFSLDRDTYGRLFSVVKEHIHEGDVYQINLTGKIRFTLDGSPFHLYQRLKRIQPVSYSAFLRSGSSIVVSLSPELFFRIDGDRITTRPMKGTAPRGRFAEEDERLANALGADPKSRAENLMIVDLLRNDLSRICRPGSVKVPRLFEIESYPTVLQMTSTIEGRLRECVTFENVIRALFPCGSVTGAPKIRAMEIIREIEPEPRGVYTGAIGMFEPNGNAAFSVAIRTLVLADGNGEMGTGGGVVWDSDVHQEYEECLLKAEFLMREPVTFQLIETMRWENGVALLDAHLERLKWSARFFGFRFDGARIRRSIRQCTRSLDPDRVHKIRLLLDHDGRVQVSAAPLDDESLNDVWRIMPADERLDSSVLFHFHKTTRRDVYDEAYARARSLGYDEALFLNEREEVCQGSRTNIFVRRGSRWVTPPVTSGLLPGIYRDHLLRALPNAVEETLSLEDVRSADEVLLCNAVRGAVQGLLD